MSKQQNARQPVGSEEGIVARRKKTPGDGPLARAAAGKFRFDQRLLAGGYQLAFISGTGPMIVEGQFAAPNLDVRRRLEAEADLPPLDLEHGHYDLLTDHDAFANLAPQH